MNAWVKIADDTYEMLVNGGSIIRYGGYAGSMPVAMVFVPQAVER
jgi:hypothetical protein